MAFAIGNTLGKVAVQALAVPFLCLQLDAVTKTAKTVVGVVTNVLGTVVGYTGLNTQDGLGKIVYEATPAFLKKAFADCQAQPKPESLQKIVTYMLLGSAGMKAASYVLGGAPLAERVLPLLGSNTYSYALSFVGR